MKAPSTLSEQIARKKLQKRERLQDALLEGRRGAGRSRRFTFDPLPFETDARTFDLLGGADARQELITGSFEGVSGVEEPCRQLVAPTDFTFTQNLAGVLSFVYELRRRIFINNEFSPKFQGHPFYVSLDRISAIDLEGALILTAELDRVRRVLGFRPILDDHRWVPEVRALLYGFGLHDVIQAKRRYDGVPVDRSDYLGFLRRTGFEILKVRTSNASSNKMAMELRDELFEACQPFSAARPKFYNVLVEAFNNSREHAYPQGSGEDGLPSVRGWWAGALISHQTGRFNLAVYDQGIGIPEQYARQHDAAALTRMIGDGDLVVLKEAAEHGATSTREPGRGNGLWQMTDLTKDVPGSQVEFTSLKGQLTYRAGELIRAATPPYRFCGTMVKWNVPFRGQSV